MYSCISKAHDRWFPDTSLRDCTFIPSSVCGYPTFILRYCAVVSNAADREQNLELCPETPYTVLCAHVHVFVKHTYMRT